MLHALEAKEIYISTKTACSSNEAVSLAVYSLTKDALCLYFFKSSVCFDANFFLVS